VPGRDTPCRHAAYHDAIAQNRARTVIKGNSMHTESSGAATGAADPLLAQACAWARQLRAAGEEVLLYPVSRLQRQFRLGYSRSFALVEALARRGEWAVGYGDDGTRYARLAAGGTGTPAAPYGDALSPPADRDAIERASALIAGADALVIAAGAGMGVDSGLPDFRGNAGFWKAYPALAAEGTAFMDIASPAAFDAGPRRAWGFYGHRLGLYRRSLPHEGYRLLRQWGEAKRHGYFVFTSNVDGHFRKTGFDPLRIDECHGSIHRLQCLLPCSPVTWTAAGLQAVEDGARCEWPGSLPACPRCGAVARPNILMFDDTGWIGARRELQAARCRDWLGQVRRPVVIEIGAGLNIPTVRHFSRRVVMRHGGSLIRINPREPHTGGLPGVGIAASALPTLAAIGALLGQPDA